MQNKTYESEMQLVFDPSLSEYNDYQVIRMTGSNLEEIGIKKDSHAIVVQESIERGDLVALRDLSTDLIVCGFYDHFGAVIAIYGMDSQTLVYKHDEASLIGKIIGIGDPEPDEDGKVHIRPVEV